MISSFIPPSLVHHYWLRVSVSPGDQIWQNCNSCSHCLNENEVASGNRVIVKFSVQLWDGIRTEADVFIRPTVPFTNVLLPRSMHYPERFPHTIVKNGASIGGGGDVACGFSHWGADPCRRWRSGDALSVQMGNCGRQPGVHRALSRGQQ